MHLSVLAADYDGTLATDGQIDAPTIAALEQLRASGRFAIMVTGRELPDLQRACPRLDLFERVVAENGALVYTPATGEQRTLAPRPPKAFVQALRERGVDPLSVGEVIVATWQQHDAAVRDVIRQQGLKLQVILNKKAVMVLPAGVDKASGLAATLAELGIDPQQAAGIGDAENDAAMLSLCGIGVAVQNALPTLKALADRVTVGERGAGVRELIAWMLTLNAE